jgi:hypothetical protein
MAQWGKSFIRLALMGSMLALLHVHAVAAVGAPVNVTNPSLPVTGKISVFNATNSDDNPVPLAVNPVGTPYADECRALASSPLNNGVGCNFHQVPVGVRLVIQVVSFSTSVLGSGNVFLATIDTEMNGTVRQTFLVPSPPVTDGGGSILQLGHQLTTPYSATGTFPGCGFFFSAPGAPLSIDCTISGYLVPVQ